MQKRVIDRVSQQMNLLQFGNRLLDMSDVVFATREVERTRILLRGGHEVALDGEVGTAVWARLAGRLVDQLPEEVEETEA